MSRTSTAAPSYWELGALSCTKQHTNKLGQSLATLTIKYRSPVGLAKEGISLQQLHQPELDGELEQAAAEEQAAALPGLPPAETDDAELELVEAVSATQAEANKWAAADIIQLGNATQAGGGGGSSKRRRRASWLGKENIEVIDLT